MFKGKILLLFIFLSPSVQAVLTETLPKGVRFFNYRYVSTTSIQSKFNQNGEEVPFSISGNLNAKTLEKSHPAANAYFEQLKQASLEAYEAFSMGAYSIDYAAQADVQVMGLGYGLTHRLTLYGYAPYYQGNVDVDIRRTEGNNYSKVVNLLKNTEKKNEFSTLLWQLTEQFQDANPELLQSMVVNYYQYQPLGDWSGKGFGDTEVGLRYRMYESKKLALMFQAAVIAPTGREDNPDILQDYAFGDGQWDALTGVGFSYFFGKHIILNGLATYIYQFPMQRQLRAPDNPQFTLTRNKADFVIKPGSKTRVGSFLEVSPIHWLTVIPEYYLDKQEGWKYDPVDQSYLPQAQVLEKIRGPVTVQTAVLGLKLSSVNAFNRKKFLLPMTAHFMASRQFAGENVPSYDRYDMELRFFF
jgi:hypothetical protein